MSNGNEAEWPIDLRHITRDPDRCCTMIRMFDPRSLQMVPWVILGKVELLRDSKQHGGAKWTLRAYLSDGATDFEHDSALALVMPLIGVELVYTLNHWTILAAYIDPEPPDPSWTHPFRVPSSDYDPAKLPEAGACDVCKEPHPIVPEGYYQPPEDRALFERVRGRRVEIWIGHPESK